MTFPFALITALVISMALIPLMIRFAAQLGMVDMPDPRKVHARPIPRVGGIGIVVGALASILLWMPLEGWLPSFLFGSIVLLVFGAWDDSRELGHYVKFIGQFAAAIAVVYWGGLWVMHLPFVSAEIQPAIGKPFSVIAIVGMINAINHSDGLDGLAGGESLLSLGCLAYLGYIAGGGAFVIFAGAVIGGVFGFLRYNTHPARVFMGDSGSQFLGFSLGVMAILLTQQINPGLSMAIPALILGLPIIDILAVLAQRVYGGMNWFRATKNHVHHRLLELGYPHYQAVIIIYGVQALFAVCAIVFCYESDGLVLGIYVAGGILIFAALALAERRAWKVCRSDSAPARQLGMAKGSRLARLAGLPLWFVQVSVPAYLIAGSIRVSAIPPDCGVVALVVAALALVGVVLRRSAGFAPALMRLGVFSAAAMLVYLIERHAGSDSAPHAPYYILYFVALALATGIAIRFAGDAQFRTTPLDYLLVGLVIVSGVLAHGRLPGLDLGTVIVQLVVLFYACELIIVRGNPVAGKALTLAALLSSFIVVVRFMSGS